MRLRNWIAAVISVLLLAAAGTIGIVVNRSALRAADTVHRTDSRALAVNNATLTGQLQLLSAGELATFLGDHVLQLSADAAADRAALNNLVAKSSYFQYGALITELDGTVLTSTRTTGVPEAADAGWAPLRKLVAGGQYGFSSIMTVGAGATAAHLEAVAVPITVGGDAVAMLVGLNNVAATPLQKYTVTLSTTSHLTLIVDSAGVIAATSDPDRLGTTIDPAILDAVAQDPSVGFVDYTSGGTKMIAIVAGGLPGGWMYVRTQTQQSFDGAVHRKSQTLTLTLLAMLLIGVVAISALGYRTQMQRRRADERFQALFQHAPDLVSVLDATGKIEFSSPSAAAVLGFESGQLVGTTVFDIVHEDDQPHMREKFEVLLGHREAVLRLQCRVRSANGEYRWFEFTASNQMHNPALLGVVI
ncbi:MAG: PAS domain S-box protein, partial [Actinoplanes sp.]